MYNTHTDLINTSRSAKCRIINSPPAQSTALLYKYNCLKTCTVCDGITVSASVTAAIPAVPGSLEATVSAGATCCLLSVDDVKDLSRHPRD